MKKILAILLAMLFVMNISFVTAFAEATPAEIALTVEFDAMEKSYNISGFVKNVNRDRIPMSLYVTGAIDGVLDAKETLAVGKTDDGIKFKFAPVKIKSTAKSQNITMKVTAAYLNCSAEVTKSYEGIDAYFTALQKVKTAIENGTEGGLLVAIEETKDLFGIDVEAFSALKEDGSSTDPKSIALKNMFLLELDLPESVDSKAECNKVYSQITAYQTQFNEAVVLGEFFNVNSNNELKAWYDENKVVYNLGKHDGLAEYEKKLVDCFEEQYVKPEYLSRIENITYVDTVEKLNVQMKNQAILLMVQKSNQNAVERALTDFSALLTNVNDANGQNPVSIDYLSWNNRLTTDQKNTVCVNVVGKDYYDLYAFINAVNSEINNVMLGGAPVFNTPSGPIGGGDRGGNKPVFLPVQEPDDGAEIMVFEDIEHVQWAKKAIHYLYANDIISGRDEQTYDPDGKVTRAELAKMLVLGFGLVGEGSTQFADVSQNAWYAEYVSIAAANGLILGDENGRFNPNMPVSRQDAAVMMYRALGGKADEKAYFEDYYLISPYAVDAVNYMAQNGIVSGVGDRIFAPLDNLTRAQAAKMIYAIIIS